jgi:ribosomal protein S15P/S13E
MAVGGLADLHARREEREIERKRIRRLLDYMNAIPPRAW